MALSVDIEKRLGDFRLRVRFASDREHLALLGASGCGKSVTLQCIAGVITPDRGRIVLNDRTLFDSEKHINLPPQQRRVGYLFQQYALFPNMTVAQNIALGAHDKKRAEREAITAEKLRTFHLESKARLKPHQLSGGEQQRAALARILAGSPELLALDEPFSALDETLKWQLELELLDTLAAFDGDVVFVSHSREEVSHLCDSVCVLTNGRSEEKQSVRELMTAPRSRSAAVLSGCRNFSALRRMGAHRVFCTDWGVTLTSAQETPQTVSCVGVRSFRVAAPGEENAISCRVTRAVTDGFNVILMLQPYHGTQQIRMELPAERWEALARPEELTVAAAPEQVMLLIDRAE